MSDTIRRSVREHYAVVARTGSSCCGPSPAQDLSLAVGYSPEEMAAAPEGANLGFTQETSSRLWRGKGRAK